MHMYLVSESFEGVFVIEFLIVVSLRIWRRDVGQLDLEGDQIAGLSTDVLHELLRQLRHVVPLLGQHLGQRHDQVLEGLQRVVGSRVVFQVVFSGRQTQTALIHLR